MRTKKQWIANFQQNYILTTFSPRIVNDLKKLDMTFTSQKAESTFIYGPVQTGKTLRAATLMIQDAQYEYLNNRMRGSHVFVSFPYVFAEIRSTFNNPLKTEAEIMERYLKADLLTIDDFLTSKPTEWVLDILYFLINYRYEQLKTTIITSNLSLPEIEHKLQDQRITSRINRMCVIEQKTNYHETA